MKWMSILESCVWSLKCNLAYDRTGTPLLDSHRDARRIDLGPILNCLQVFSWDYSKYKLFLIFAIYLNKGCMIENKMRKVVFVAILLIFIGGGILKRQEIKHFDTTGTYISDDYIKTNWCAQELLWFPIGAICGPLFLLIPKKTIEWLIEPLSSKIKKQILVGIHLGALRFFGVILIVSVFVNFPPGSCIDVIQNLFGR